MSDTSGGKKRGGLFDDLAGVAGGAFSALAGVRGEVEAAVRSQVDQMVQRLDLVKREDLDAAMELARRAREAQEVLEARVAALEAKLGQAAAPAAGPEPDLAPRSAEDVALEAAATGGGTPEAPPPIEGTMKNPPPIGGG
ncbi:accessory factor UbiK family protein [Paeniroseomonas aquatica]|uniref:Accessory factor UbiK family protein n=1 Tax=Paeniroseomonas aquatica TaxID=373043 RepID=A0ABT8AC44_9PROT|nr:accessory factor UbiK family protein [Paeniroseomonas aquatica]MDN3567392.1 accessory factor UbiK family protein [Paeniroseomonas aquatica]